MRNSIAKTESGRRFAGKELGAREGRGRRRKLVPRARLRSILKLCKQDRGTAAAGARRIARVCDRRYTHRARCNDSAQRNVQCHRYRPVSRARRMHARPRDSPRAAPRHAAPAGRRGRDRPTDRPTVLALPRSVRSVQRVCMYVPARSSRFASSRISHYRARYRRARVRDIGISYARSHLHNLSSSVIGSRPLMIPLRIADISWSFLIVVAR